MLHLFTNLETHTSLLLVLALVLVLSYEVVNGFHDTANAVATIIYTRVLCSRVAVAMSSIFNFLGVLISGLSVAYAIVHLLPTDLLLNLSSTCSLLMIFSMLLAASIWNIGTWYFGLPSSSSHTLIGSIIGISLANALINDSSIVQALNFPKIIEVFWSLIIYPILGIILAGTIVFILRRYWNGTLKQRSIHLTPEEREKNNDIYKLSFFIRVSLIFSSASVSFFHGANDGQKGIGIIMLLLIGIAPARFAVDINSSSCDINRTYNAVNNLQLYYNKHQSIFKKIIIHNKVLHPFMLKKNNFAMSTVSRKSFYQVKSPRLLIFHCNMSPIILAINEVSFLLKNLNSYESLNINQRFHIRHLLICIVDIVDKLINMPEISKMDKIFLLNLRRNLSYTLEYAPTWIIVAVALALSLGTMVGWRRVATTIGEKIGKKGMTYAQGLSAQTITAISIGVASYTGMPVSTTHVLASAITGAMLADGSGIRAKTLKNILLAWVLTLPVSIILAGTLYWLLLIVI